MVDISVYEDSRLLFQFKTHLNIMVGECIYYLGKNYKVIGKTYNTYDEEEYFAKLYSISLEVIEIEE